MNESCQLPVSSSKFSCQFCRGWNCDLNFELGIGNWKLPISSLLPDSQPLNQLGVARGVFALEVIEQPSALAYELEQTAPRVMILRVRLEMFGEVIDAFAEDGDLNLWRTGVTVVLTVRADEIGLLVFR
jgi:hypothetical protein